MKYSIETTAGELDVYEDVDISLNYQINDILDLNSRNTNWSKTIKVPGTQKNNLFFKNIYDVNIDNDYGFNPKQRIAAKIRVAGDEVFTGYMQLLNINEINKDIEYEISLVGLLGTLFNNMGDYTFGQLDLSEYDHEKTRAIVASSWDGVIVKNGEAKNAEPGEGYVYPKIYYGNIPTETGLYLEDMYPAFYVKTIWDSILKSAGYTYTSNFLNGDIFTKLIVPFNGDKTQLTESNCNTGVAGYTLDDYNTTVGMDWLVYPGLTQAYKPVITDKNNVSYYTYWGWGWAYNSGVAEYNVNLNRISGTKNNVNFSDTTSYLKGPATDGFNGFFINESGQYDIDINLSMAPLVTNQKMLTDPTATVEWKSGALEYRYQLLVIDTNGNEKEIASSKNGSNGQWGVNTFNLDTGSHTFNYSQNMVNGYIYEDVDINIRMNVQGVYLNAGEKVVIRIGQNMPKTTKFVGSALTNNRDRDHQFMLMTRSAEKNNLYTTYANIKKSSNDSGIGTCISANQVLDNNIKWKDFILSIVKMFNLVISDNPNKPNDLIIEPYDDWFGTKPYISDWEAKLDEDTVVKLTPTPDLDFNKYRYTYTEDKDWLNTEYTSESNGLIFGEYSNIVDNPFADETSEIKVIFGPTPVKGIEEGVAIPYFTTYANDEYSPYKTNIRILFWQGVVDTPNTIPFYDSFDAYLNGSNDYSISQGYPVATMWNDLQNPTDTLEWGRSYKQYFDTNVFANGTLYEKYHKSTLTNIISTNSMIMECDILLTPKEIAEFDFRNLIFLRESYWRVNEIKDYNPINSDKLTTVVLYKVIDLDIQGKFQVQVPQYNKGCKKTIIEKKGKKYVYQNEDGSAITEECCTAIGGVNFKGLCVMNDMYEPPSPPFVPNTWGSGPETWTPWTQPSLPTFKPVKGQYQPVGGIYTAPINEKEGPLVLNKNKSKNNGIYVKSLGYENIIPKEVKNTLIVGNNNSIVEYNDNNIVLGNDIIANESGSIFLQNAKINKYGQISTIGIKVIDGGKDVVFPFDKVTPTEIIDGTIDSVRNPGAYSWSRPIIDGNPYKNDIE